MGVLVIGMHRSGTSALAGALEAAGLSVGPTENLMPADLGNPDGHLEIEAVGDLNDEILVRFGGSWDAPPALADGWAAAPEVDTFVDRARLLVDSSFEGSRFVLKDPRFSLLLPVWRRALLDRFCAVVIVRDPTAVAWSLALRDGLTTLTGFALWSSYYRAAVEGLSGLQVHVCRYEELVENPAAVLPAVIASLREWGELPEDAEVDPAIARVKPGLQRNTWPRSQMEFELPGEVSALDKLLGELEGRHESFDIGVLPERGWWEHDLLEERRLAGLRLRASGGEIARGERDQLLNEVRHLEFEARRHLDLLEELQGRIDEAREEAELLRLAHVAIESGVIMRVTSPVRRAYARLRAALHL